MTFSQWLKANRVMLVILAAVATFLFIKFDAEGLWSIAKAALGLSFVVFVHELGHFLVAKWCDVHVTTFSIGFGPALPGCKFKWGETTYMLALFPLGGYVQMVGQVDGDESSDGTEEDPRSYKNKTVWQRMAIISAGVIMNVLLAFICFIIVFEGPGKDRKAAVIAATDTGSPAYRKGLPTGAVIEQIGDVKEPYFEDLLVTVMTTTYGEKLKLVYQQPDQEPVSTEIEPRLGPDDKRPVIGIQPAPSLELMPQRYVGKSMEQPAYPNSPAARAEPPFEFGDHIVATTDPDQAGPYDPKKIKELPLDPRKHDGQQRDYFAFTKRLRELAGKPMVMRVERGKNREKVDILVSPAFHQTLGARMKMGQVTAARNGSAAAELLQQRDTSNTVTREGDVLKAVEVREPDGSPTRYVETVGTPELAAQLASAVFLPPWAQPLALARTLEVEKPLDPTRLPDQLRAWAKRMRDHGKKDLTVTLQVKRHRAAAGNTYEMKTVTLPWDFRWEFDNEVPFGMNSPLSIPELGFAYRIQATVLDVGPRPADGLKAGDVVKRIRYHGKNAEGKVEDLPWLELKGDQWARVFWTMQSPEIVKVTLEVERNGQTKELTIEPLVDKHWPRDERGLLLAADVRLQKASNLMEAIGMGLKDTLNNMGQVYQNLRGMLTGRISTDNLGGPVMIATVAYRIAGIDFWEFLFFLGLISVNLAVINFLPIPVLDGGHMVFLIYEKIRGKPASEAVRVGATYAGLLMLASLMLFVLFLDIKRLL